MVTPCAPCVNAEPYIVSWDVSREAARALFDALPLLKAAQTVILLNIATDGRENAPGPGSASGNLYLRGDKPPRRHLQYGHHAAHRRQCRRRPVAGREIPRQRLNCDGGLWTFTVDGKRIRRRYAAYPEARHLAGVDVALKVSALNARRDWHLRQP